MVNDNESEDGVSRFAMVDGVSRYPPDLDREDAVCRFAMMPRRPSRSTECERLDLEGEGSNDDDERKDGEGS